MNARERPRSVSKDVKSALVGLLPRLRRFGIALTGSRSDGDDLVQQTCERALTRMGQLQSEERLDRWLYAIMRHCWMDEVRSRQVRRHEQIEAADNLGGEDGVAVAEGRMTLAKVRATLATLPQEQRLVLVLVCVDGMSYKEAAEVLDIPVGTVMSRLARGRQELHWRLHRQAGEGSQGAAASELNNGLQRNTAGPAHGLRRRRA
jgi:RNA polymerase sigma-70 factor (ECF subfamily)